MGRTLEKLRPAVTLAVILLLMLELITLPLVLNYTLAAPVSANHTLTYTKGNLVWDSDTELDKSGAALLTLFDTLYENVQSSDGDKIIAPGTTGENTVRLQNMVSGSISYTAVFYHVICAEDENALLPLAIQLSGSGFTNTDSYTLPDGIEKSDVFQAVQGSVQGNGIQDFTLSWEWPFESLPEETESSGEPSESGDALDSSLGAVTAAGEEMLSTVGIYIVVQDENNYGSQSIMPKTGDNSHVTLYLVILLLTALILMLLLTGEARRRARQKRHEQRA